jgi:selenocysteine-specific elongation factor
VCDAGDRLVLRTYSPPRVIGGATVLNARAQAHRRSDVSALERLRLTEQGDPGEVLAGTVERAGLEGSAETALEAGALATLSARGEIIVIGGRAYHRAVLDALGARAVELANAHVAAHPLQWGIDKEELRRRLSFPHSAPVFNRVIEKVAETSPLFVRESRVRAGSLEMTLSPGLARVMAELVERIRAAGVAFPTRDELAVQWASREPFADAATVLRDHPDLVELAEGWMHREAMERSLAALGALFASRGEVAVGDLKDALGITRKHAIPLLEYFDSHGITVRRGNARVAGPGLADAKKLVEKPKLGLPDSR